MNVEFTHDELMALRGIVKAARRASFTKGLTMFEFCGFIPYDSHEAHEFETGADSLFHRVTAGDLS